MSAPVSARPSVASGSGAGHVLAGGCALGRLYDETGHRGVSGAIDEVVHPVGAAHSGVSQRVGYLDVASLHTLGRRILALEARLAELEGGDGDTLSKLNRASVKTDLRMAKLLDHLKIDDVSDDEVGRALGEE